MDLKNFVKQALADITSAVEEAKDISPVSIAPGYVTTSKGRTTIVDPQLIEFDIATTVVDASSLTGGGSAKISVIGVGISVDGKRDSAVNHESVSRVKFQVPVYFQAKNDIKK
ncbi:hypothetical protein [Maridesulfovibrio ferrireducens]|uniref:hypothetical protein n=1 Tax=Maridesulfovibrio ferrireducens TaxID=246191 RepID=UPI001A1CA1CC|nr:hypothetical protein [Maridesulfovibrio ferrireducens]MBI9109922.1 hypothetical protein [Maridesulfovibrio ferrireducens]